MVRALKRDLAACEKANTDMQKGRDAAEAREGATEGKLRLERQARKGMILESPCFLLDPTHGELIGTVLTGAEARLAVAVMAMGQLIGKVSAVLAAFEPEGIVAAEELDARLEAARGRLGVFARGVFEDMAQFTLGLVKFHFPEADLEPVGDWMAPETSDLAWADSLADSRPIAECVAADLNL